MRRTRAHYDEIVMRMRQFYCLRRDFLVSLCVATPAYVPYKDPWPWLLLMELAFVIAVPTLLLAVCLTGAYEREICILMLDWLQAFESKRLTLSGSAFRRLVERQTIVKPRPSDNLSP